jgi:hypothetical protein
VPLIHFIPLDLPIAIGIQIRKKTTDVMIRALAFGLCQNLKHTLVIASEGAPLTPAYNR